MDQSYALEYEDWDPYLEIQKLIETNPWAWQSVCAVAGLLGGLLSPVLGTLLIAVTRFIPTQHLASTLEVLSIISFALTIPLLTIGAHCLDLLERKTAKLSLSATAR